MKKILGTSLLFILLLTGCGSNEDDKTIDTLNVSFVPSAPADEILSAAAPLEDMLKEELGNSGYTVNNVDINVGTTYEAVGEALTAGTTDIALIPGGTYVMYEEDGAEIALTATRDALNVDSDNPQDWNKEPNHYVDGESATFYRSLIVAGPSEKGQALSEKVANGEDLTFDELADAQWCVQSASSSAGYLYPSLWLTDNYGKSMADLPNQVEIKGYGDAISRLSAGQCDIAPMYADARGDNGASWSRDEDIWDATNVIGVTDPIMNDTISVSTESDVYSEDFLKAVQDAFINIASTEEGLATVEPYSHTGYEIGNPDDYAAEREVQLEVIDSLNN